MVHLVRLQSLKSMYRKYSLVALKSTEALSLDDPAYLQVFTENPSAAVFMLRPSVPTKSSGLNVISFPAFTSSATSASHFAGSRIYLASHLGGASRFEFHVPSFSE